MVPELVSSECLSLRLSQASELVGRGDWASGHAVLAGLRDCANSGGCGRRTDCASAAEQMLCQIRQLVAN